MYLLHGKVTSKKGYADEVANILLQASRIVSTVKGCRLYVVSKDQSDLNAVYVTAIWENKKDHDNSLKLEGIKELMLRVMPILVEQPTKGQELETLGGLGI
jgi:quinol monooxygenase YgiN